MPHAVPLVHVVRGGRVESLHRGCYALIQDGVLLAHAGDPEHRSYYRSTSKPFQSMACVVSGAADQFGFDDRALALAAGSHNATPAHLAVARGMLAAAGLTEADLQCGGHWSIDSAEARRQVAKHGADFKPKPAVWSNCSGKHSSMLASAVALGAPTSTYLDPTHPVQVGITDVLAACADVQSADIGLGTDGCGAPVHAVPLSAMARSLWRLGCPDALPAPFADAARRVGAAMAAEPEMVAGGRRFDTDLMQSASRTILSKSGAEGVQGVAVPELKLGLAIQVDDGADRGYRQVVIELLRRHGALTDSEADGLAERHGRTIKNHAGNTVGHLKVMV